MKRLSLEEAFKLLLSKGVFRSDSYDIISFLLNLPYAEAVNMINLAAVEAKVMQDDLENVIKLLESNIPVAYITRRKEFYGREFYVDENVLIPRPDTELLVEKALKTCEKYAEVNIVDYCTGSGCILLTVMAELAAKGKKSHGTGVDISYGALGVAKRNSVQFGVEADFMESDILGCDIAEQLFALNVDVVTANPPYLTADEYMFSDQSLKKEPPIALVAADKGLIFYKKLLCEFAKFSSIYGRSLEFFFETGYEQSEIVVEIAASHGISCCIHKDLNGHGRVVQGKV